MDARLDVASGLSIGPPLIVCDDVGHVYRSERGDTVALESLSLNIRRGEFVCVLGPSGCGKTTLLNILAGFVSPSHGGVRIADEPIEGPSSDRGVVFQDYSLFPWLTAQANVEFGLRMAGRSSRDRSSAAEALLELVGLPGVGRKYPFELSGGMKQRVAIARTLVLSPEVLLMDEPFGALDAQTRLSMQALLLSLWDRRRSTVLFVTHDVDEALILADVVYVMSAAPGRIIRRIDVDTPRPRAVDRLDQAFLDRRAHIIGLLRQQHVTDIT